MSNPKNEMGTGAVGGFQIPLGIKKRKNKVDELLSLNEDLNEGHALSYLSSLDEAAGENIGKKLDSCEYNEVADHMRSHAVRELVRKRVREVVRKKAGGGGFVLYSPNNGKKKAPKPVGEFPTKLGAKRAELARFPPKEPGKLGRLRREVDKLVKNPKKAAEKEKQAAAEKGTAKKKKPEPKKESKLHEAQDTYKTGDKVKLAQDPGRRGEIATDKTMQRRGLDYYQVKWTHQNDEDPNFPTVGSFQWVPEDQLAADDNKAESTNESMFRRVVAHLLKESLFREEKTGSEWDEYIGKLSGKALTGDKKFQTLQKNIEKRTENVLNTALGSIKKALKKDVKLKDFGIKRSDDGKTYTAFSAVMDNVEVGPVYIYVEGGVPKIEVSDGAKAALTKTDPDSAKLFRAELVTVQERVLDKMDDLTNAIDARDKYLVKVEGEVDGFVSGLTPLQVSMLKNLLVKKYRRQ